MQESGLWQTERQGDVLTKEKKRVVHHNAHTNTRGRNTKIHKENVVVMSTDTCGIGTSTHLVSTGQFRLIAKRLSNESSEFWVFSVTSEYESKYSTLKYFCIMIVLSFLQCRKIRKFYISSQSADLCVNFKSIISQALINLIVLDI